MWFFVYFIIMGDEYKNFLVDLIKHRIRDLRLRLDRSKNPVCEDDKLTTSEIATIEAEIKHCKLELKLMYIEYDF